MCNIFPTIYKHSVQKKIEKEYQCSLYPWYEQCETLNQIFFFSTRPSGDEHPKGYNAFTPHLGSGLQSTNIHFLFEKRREQKKYIESVYFSMTRSAYEKNK